MLFFIQQNQKVILALLKKHSKKNLFVFISIFYEYFRLDRTKGRIK
jgi:hypothetical protein